MSKQLDPLKTTTPELHSGKDTVIIAGDSWACGEWDRVGDGYSVVHKGLEQYLLDDGYRVINKGEPGCDNTTSIDNLCLALTDPEIDHSTTKAFLFCTEWTRDVASIQRFHQEVSPTGTDPLFLQYYDHELAHRIWHRLLKRIEKISLSSKINIGLIGGCADTITVGNNYQGIYNACISMVNLCLDQVEWTHPVLTLFKQPYDGYCGISNKTQPSEDLLNDIQLGLDREKLWMENPEWFWPDGGHANRMGHKKLFDWLKLQQFV